MSFRIVLLVNGKYRKTIGRYKRRRNAFADFYKLIEDNKVIFPKKYTNGNKIRLVKYEICITKPTEETDTFRIIHDKLGRLVTEKPLGDWTILTSEVYNIEETFWMFGFDPRISRPTITEIIKRIIMNTPTKSNPREVWVVHNKLLIFNENEFDMVICKNRSDAQRLNRTLYNIAKDEDLKLLLFMGAVNRKNIGNMYLFIQEKTKWPISKIHRKTTRP
jgi:hypothetical protein